MHTRIYTHIYPTANTQFGMRRFVVPDSITAIDREYVSMRVSRTEMNSVIFHPNVTSILTGAFKDCSGLKTVHLPKSVKLIEEEAFAGCVELQSVTIQPGIESIEEGAFRGCTSLVDVQIPLMSKKRILEPDVFIGCNENLILNIGRIKDVNKPNFWKGFGGGNGIARTATVEHELPDDAGTCIAQYNWPASKVIRRTDRYGCPMYAATDPDPPTLFDGTGIKAPLLLQTLSGDEYPVYNCWGSNPVAHPDFQRLATEQHPDALGDMGKWKISIDKSWICWDTLDLMKLGNMLVRGEFHLTTPVIVWTNDEDSDESGVEDANKLSSSDSDDSDEDFDESGVEDANEPNRPDSDNKSGTPIEDANTLNRTDKDSAASIAFELERTLQLCDMCC